MPPVNSWICLVLCSLLLLHFSQAFVPSCRGRYSRSVLTLGETSSVQDPYETFTPFERLLFRRFADSVSAELNDGSPSAADYKELMASINRMTNTRPLTQVNQQGKSMLVRLFPSWLLPLYKVLIQGPLPRFSALMNCFVTKWTTNWLMGPSEVYDLDERLPDGTVSVVAPSSGLLIEKCRFLESTGCVKTCLHACKVPTQSFFMEEMGLPVTLSPNMSDLSCRFQFGVVPVDLRDDPINLSPCLDICAKSNPRAKANSSPCT